MNERIRDLMIQCETGYSQDHDNYFYNMEKFAELIVKDCMSIAEELKVEYYNCRIGTPHFEEKNIYAEGESACFNLRYKMKKHFGVEE